MTTPPTLTKKEIDNEFAKITEEIKRLESMIAENKATVKQLHSKNHHMRETIKELKRKRTEVAFMDFHVRER